MAQTQENKISKMNSKHDHARLGISVSIQHAKKTEVLGKNINRASILNNICLPTLF